MSHTFAVDDARHRERENRRETLEINLRAAHVSPAIIERVLRLNPNPESGTKLRGIHYKDAAHSYRFARFVSKGRFIRRYGREAFERIPTRELHKDGRRIYVSATGAAEVLAA